jgi:hypothetical protein
MLERPGIASAFGIARDKWERQLVLDKMLALFFVFMLERVGSLYAMKGRKVFDFS